MKVRAALAIGLALLALVLVLVLSSSPAHVAGKNSVATQSGSVAAQVGIASAHGYAHACQGGELLPPATTAVRLSFEASVGPSVTVTARSGTRVLTSGTRASGWTGAQVTVPVARVTQATPGTTICFLLGQSREVVSIFGLPSSAAVAASSDGRPLAGRIGIEYLEPGRRSWWSQALSVARRIGLGRAPSGTWIAVVIALLMAAVAALASGLSIYELEPRGRERAQTRRATARLLTHATAVLGRAPTAAWVCALVACGNAVCWSLLTPPFQVPEEPAHFAYVQQLAEAHRLPVGSGEEYSAAENTTLEDLHHGYVQFVPSQGTISSRTQEQQLEDDLRRRLSMQGPGDAGRAASEPPLYYALETIPYELGSGGTLLDQLALMRLLSALFGALTAFFTYMFVREAAPGSPWAWTVGGLGVALAPLLGFVSGAVNPDAMLAAVSALIFYLLARAFRRGLTPRLGAAIGAAAAIGLFTKLNFLGLAPGVIVGLLVLTLRAPAGSCRRRAARALAVALALAVGPVILYLVLTSLARTASPSFISSSASSATAQHSIVHEIAYIWQLYLPRLPGMTNYFPGLFTARQLWFDGLVGLYGWADTLFPGWVCTAALLPAGAIALLCLRALVSLRGILSSRIVELLVYTTMAIGLLVLVGVGSYANGRNGPFSEPRYLLPLFPLLAPALALAARGAGRRWGPAAGAAIIILVLAHDIFSQLLVVSRYYS